GASPSAVAIELIGSARALEAAIARDRDAVALRGAGDLAVVRFPIAPAATVTNVVPIESARVVRRATGADRRTVTGELRGRPAIGHVPGAIRALAEVVDHVAVA